MYAYLTNERHYNWIWDTLPKRVSSGKLLQSDPNHFVGPEGNLDQSVHPRGQRTQAEVEREVRK